MPRIGDDDRVDPCRVYRFFGVDLRPSGDQWLAECPFCGREKFYVGRDNGVSTCHGCPEVDGSLNPQEFLRTLWRFSDDHTRDYSDLAADRGLLYPETLIEWGAVRSAVTGEWLLPGYTYDGRLHTLYRYARPRPGEKPVLLAAPGFDHGLFGVPLYDRRRPEVYLCEGPWDGMALWESLRMSRGADGDLRYTAAPGSSLLRSASVLAAPGVNVFPDYWKPLFAGKVVTVMYDSDHPRGGRDGRAMAPVGLSGVKRVVGSLAAGPNRPAEVRYLKWGDGGYDPDLPSGYDVRDALRGAADGPGRVEAVRSLLRRVAPVPDGWGRPGTPGATPSVGAGGLELVPCRTWAEVKGAWDRAMEMIPGLDVSLSVMLATVASTPCQGVQLWTRVLGPPSSGKSALCEGISVNRRYVYPKDTMTSLVSGYQVDRDGTEDLSMAPRLRGMCLAIKDGDTILQLPNRDQVLSQLRAMYDRSLRTQRGNRMTKDHEGLNTSLVICGTESMRVLDASELGERWLTVRVVDGIDGDLERSITTRAIFSELRDVGRLANGRPESQDSPEMVRAKQTTGGYIDWLRANPDKEAGAVAGRTRDDAVEVVADLAKFVAVMRTRGSGRQKEKVQREMSHRLGRQFARLAAFLAVVLNRDEIDDEVVRRVRKVAVDSSVGRTLDIVRAIDRAGSDGLSVGSIAHATGEDEKEEAQYVKLLRQIGAVSDHVPVMVGVGGRTVAVPGAGRRYRLTDETARLYRVVFPGGKG